MFKGASFHSQNVILSDKMAYKWLIISDIATICHENAPESPAAGMPWPGGPQFAIYPFERPNGRAERKTLKRVEVLLERQGVQKI